MIDIELIRLEPEHNRPEFDCGDSDLNDFFHTDSIKNDQQLMSVTYVVKHNDSIVAFFSISNDAVIKKLIPNSIRNKIFRKIPWKKQHKSTPAVKVGRLATAKHECKKGYGTQILDFIKWWFTHGNKTGCRFLLVDAYNTEKPLNFYKKNGFDFLDEADENEETRLMYFDLKTFKSD